MKGILGPVTVAEAIAIRRNSALACIASSQMEGRQCVDELGRLDADSGLAHW